MRFVYAWLPPGKTIQSAMISLQLTCSLEGQELIDQTSDDKPALANVTLDRIATGMIASTGAVLALLVGMWSFPLALTGRAPEVARWINPRLAEPTLVLTGRLRRELLAPPEVVAAVDEPTRSDGIRSQPTSATVRQPTVPSGATTGQEDAADSKPVQSQLRSGEAGSVEAGSDHRSRFAEKIGHLASRALLAEPLASEAYALVSIAAVDSRAELSALTRSVEMSRREAFGLYRLLVDAVAAKNADAAIIFAEILLKSQISLRSYVLRHLAELAEQDDTRSILIQNLRRHPFWRTDFIVNLPRVVTSANVVAEFLLQLKGVEGELADREYAPILWILLQQGAVEQAYELWLQMLPLERASKLGNISNPSFEDDSSSVPFDWLIRNSPNALLSIVRRDDRPDQRALQVAFLPVRGAFSGLQQVVALAPGGYRLSGSVRGRINARRGLKWRMTCAGVGSGQIADSGYLSGRGTNWTRFEFSFTVPETSGCAAQRLALILDARSPSETIASGEILIDDLELARTEGLGETASPTSR